MTVCPILKVTEALYRGGIQAAPEGDESCSCKIDSIEYIFDDAPVIMGLNAFDSVRKGSAEPVMDAPIESLRVIDKLHTLEVRQSIKDLLKTGAADVPTREDIIKKYSRRGGLQETERAMVTRIKELTGELISSRK